MRGALILCGGRSTRMGTDKASLPFGDETLLQRAVRRISPVVDEVVVVARRAQVLPPLPARVVMAYDDIEDQGPLRGLLAGLRAAQSELLFAMGCDAPFVRNEVVAQLFDAASDHDAAVIEAEGYVHPLAAVYRRSVLSEVAALLAEDIRRPIALFDRVPTARVSADDLRAIDASLETLRNCNRADGYEAALADWQQRPRVTVELFEMARQLAGVAQIEVVARTVREALQEAGSLCPPLEHTVVRNGIPVDPWRVSLGGGAFTDQYDAPVAHDDKLVIVSALAGG